MRTLTGVLFLTAGLTLGPARHVVAQDQSVVREELAKTAQIAGQKMVALAKAMPEETYSWRPGEGVRSVAEVYIHVMNANYGFPAAVGGTQRRDSTVTAASSKETIVNGLKASFDYLEGFIRTFPADRLDEHFDMGGEDATCRAVLLVATTHLSEHLGQSIAYARMNGVVPPWSR